MWGREGKGWRQGSCQDDVTSRRVDVTSSQSPPSLSALGRETLLHRSSDLLGWMACASTEAGHLGSPESKGVSCIVVSSGQGLYFSKVYLGAKSVVPELSKSLLWDSSSCKELSPGLKQGNFKRTSWPLSEDV